MATFPTYFTNPAFWKTFVTADRFSFEQIPDLSGKTALVTGANTGIGYAITVALASRGAHVIMACRSKTKCLDAMTRIRDEIKRSHNQSHDHSNKNSVVKDDVKLEFLELDMSRLSSVRDSADRFLKTGKPLHILVNNAGIMACEWGLTPDGIEQHFAINHLALKQNQPSRIVNLSSLGHEMSVSGGIDLSGINDPKAGNASALYGRSKLASLLFTKSLARQLRSERVFINAAHPGITETTMCYHSADAWGFPLQQIMRIYTKKISYTPAQGALTPLYCATSPEIEQGEFKDEDDETQMVTGIRGKYFIPIANQLNPNKRVESKTLQDALWTFSLDLVREKLGSNETIGALVL
ncbi:hypothetical protein EDD11_006614 [Mortierella claussenii]|nr:hypothetical protein EDD11_006614 [Mortierella claussenii]